MGFRLAHLSVTKPEAILAKLDKPSATPSMTPSQAAATPRLARKAGSSVVAISCDQSLRSDAKPMPKTARLSQGDLGLRRSGLSGGMGGGRGLIYFDLVWV